MLLVNSVCERMKKRGSEGERKGVREREKKGVRELAIQEEGLRFFCKREPHPSCSLMITMDA